MLPTTKGIVVGVVVLTAIPAQVALAQAGSIAEPFFSNDAVGFIKVVVFFGAIVASLIGIVVKMLGSQFREKQREQATDITNLGKKVDANETDVTRATERVQTLALDVADLRSQIGGVRESMGEIKGSIARIEGNSREVQHDITQLITEMSNAIQQQIRDIAVELARLQERDKLSVELRALRQQSKGGT